MASSLIIGKKAKQNLNKQQQTFNRLVKKVEKLRVELEQTSKTLSQKLEFYSVHISPLEQQLIDFRKAGVKLFYKFYQDKKLLSKKDKKHLLEIMAEQLQGILQPGGAAPDEEIKEIFAAVEGLSYSDAAKEDFARMKEDMSETFQNLGLDIDLEDFHADLSEEEMMRKMAELLGSIKEQAEAQEAARPTRKKSKKQLEKEAREQQVEEVKNKNIASIYKQLARVLHPDLEQDATLKLQKEDLMKELTLAYDKGDLHTLLRLELAWIQKEENNLEKLSDEKLSIYNQALKQQVDEIQEEIYLLLRHPRYQPLQNLTLFAGDIKHINLTLKQRELQQVLKDVEGSLTALKGDNPLPELKDIIRTYLQAKREAKLFEIDFSEFFR